MLIDISLLPMLTRHAADAFADAYSLSTLYALSSSLMLELSLTAVALPCALRRRLMLLRV